MNEHEMYDEVIRPKHYQLWDGMEAIEAIRELLTAEEFAGYCKGNILKYRLRAGKKGMDAKALQDLDKADQYEILMIPALMEIKAEEKDTQLALPDTGLRIRDLWGGESGHRVPMTVRHDLRCPCGSAYVRESATHHSCQHCGRVWENHWVEELEKEEL